jgi:hypothetical protein
MTSFSLQILGLNAAQVGVFAVQKSVFGGPVQTVAKITVAGSYPQACG